MDCTKKGKDTLEDLWCNWHRIYSRLQTVSLLLWLWTGMNTKKEGAISEWQRGDLWAAGVPATVKRERLQWFQTTFLMPCAPVTEHCYWSVYELMTRSCHFAANLHTICKTIQGWRSCFCHPFRIRLRLCAWMCCYYFNKFWKALSIAQPFLQFPGRNRGCKEKKSLPSQRSTSSKNNALNQSRYIVQYGHTAVHVGVIVSLMPDVKEHQKCCMKQLQSLFSMWLAPLLLSDHRMDSLLTILYFSFFFLHSFQQDFAAKERLLAVYTEYRLSRDHFQFLSILKRCPSYGGAH